MTIVMKLFYLKSISQCNKDYKGEKAEVSTAISHRDSYIVHVYVPEYKIHLEMPKMEWSGQDAFILQKDYKVCCIVYYYLGVPMIVSFIGLILLTNKLFK